MSPAEIIKKVKSVTAREICTRNSEVTLKRAEPKAIVGRKLLD